MDDRRMVPSGILLLVFLSGSIWLRSAQAAVAESYCLEDEHANIVKPCQHYNDIEMLYQHYAAKLENALEAAHYSHPVKRAWRDAGEVVDVDSVAPPRVLNEIEARVLVAYARATLQGFKMNNSDPLGDQLVDPLFYFLSKAYEKLQRYGKNTSETLYFVKTDKGGYGSCWPRWPTRFTQPEIGYKELMKAMALSGDRGTIYQIHLSSAVDYGQYLTGDKTKFKPKYLLMPCSKFMVTDREIRNRRKFVYLEETKQINNACTTKCEVLLIPLLLILALSSQGI